MGNSKLERSKQENRGSDEKMKAGETYRCSICGNVVKVVKVGGGKLVCCGQEMNLAK